MYYLYAITQISLVKLTERNDQVSYKNIGWPNRDYTFPYLIIYYKPSRKSLYGNFMEDYYVSSSLPKQIFSLPDVCFQFM